MDLDAPPHKEQKLLQYEKSLNAVKMRIKDVKEKSAKMKNAQEIRLHENVAHRTSVLRMPTFLKYVYSDSCLTPTI